MVIEQFAELLHGRVVDEVALRHRRRVPRRGLELSLHLLRRPIVLERRAEPPGQVVALGLRLGEAKLMGQHLIVSTELWDKVRARKAATRARYMRVPDGTLLGKPEAGLLMKSLLTGFLRCGVCGGSMAHMSKNNRTPRYYCVERGRRGTCSNNGGVPMRELDREVLAKLHVKLTDEDVIWDLCTERVARWRQAHARPVKERANHAQQIKRLEREISNLVGLVAKGQALPDIEKAIGERRGQVDALQLKLAEPVDIHLDRESLRAVLTMIRTLRNGDRIIDDPKNDFIIYEPSHLTGPPATEHDPVGVRSALRKLGVQRIIIKPVADGWTFEGVADLGRLVNNKGKTAPPSPPGRGSERPGEPEALLVSRGAPRFSRHGYQRLTGGRHDGRGPRDPP